MGTLMVFRVEDNSRVDRLRMSKQRSGSAEVDPDFLPGEESAGGSQRAKTNPHAKRAAAAKRRASLLAVQQKVTLLIAHSREACTCHQS
jgi:hypothetical protein